MNYKAILSWKCCSFALVMHKILNKYHANTDVSKSFPHFLWHIIGFYRIL
jgi:hypothetical protein